jgi:hypothetical protein
VETSTIFRLLRFLARVLALGGFAIAVIVLGSLLQSELATAWASGVRRFVKRDNSQKPESPFTVDHM